ncbi:D-aminoacyl-tRNA deacylase [Natranaerobius thermophilus]|uniref:D-aminoacyl-tRNA deacylase n=1 Tax=Natranaerobius thermophilus (strain ATCC BAA-1301 / DSM 18059 / JW/NM-WN-LF) TaxID=457570 RepID=DTD_NATTJ|nr:D-aminoacyl-tRNA deacylase [Natranaerobius thermophilus]B2A2F7.1 RecName: Full=D-aminoacyl-tRNA deacylase; Short=DTD; AltName: Full=Gly-tRNA(Ala) deacylase [Natranaerobius thermophilus JW/NM-WN-LF]ACB84872.1 D-tyrosyl-tRNA(Tyr) deacylase [Natranaerobius thermophilus JW/NM-WN-LF]
MRAVVQRVSKSYVNVNGEKVGEINQGLNVLLGVEDGDGEDDIKYLVDKIVNLRIFEDDQGKMNLSVNDIGGELLVISQFTLLGDCRKGRRPNFMKAASPEIADELYQKFVEKVSKDYGLSLATGSFKEHMEVDILNDGPVTILLDSNKKF